MTPRHLIPSLLTLFLAAPAHAIPITSYMMGHVTTNLTIPASNPPVYAFTPGEAFWVECLVDDDPSPNYPFPARLRVELFTLAGFRKVMATASNLPGISDGGDNYVHFSQTDRSVDIVLGLASGSITYSRDAGAASEGFRGTVGRITAAEMLVPEPSGLRAGVVGGILAVVGFCGNMRRRAAKCLT